MACSTSSPPIDLEEAFPDQCPETTCTTGPTISTSVDLVTLIEATPDWVVQGRPTTGCLSGSDDITISGTLTLDGSTITVPEPCGSQNGCRQQVMFRLAGKLNGGMVPGVTCVDNEEFFDFTLCASITVEDTTKVRLRMLTLEVEPAVGSIPVVEVIAACDAPCGGTELACEANHTCWGDVRDHCAYCLGGDNEQCACWDGAAFQADGSACDFYTSGDLIESGTCRGGTCIANQ